MILPLLFNSQLRKTKDFVFFETETVPIISSLYFVCEINLISNDIVTHGFLFAHLCAAVPAPASIIEQI